MVFLASTDYLQSPDRKKEYELASWCWLYNILTTLLVYGRFEWEERKNMLEYIVGCRSNCLFVINDEERLVFATTGGCL